MERNLYKQMVAVTKFTEEAILDAAERVIAAAGLDGASIAAVARQAGAPSGSIYHRYPTRKHLLGALWIRIAAGYRDSLMQAIESPDRGDLATRVVTHTFSWVEANPDRAELLMRFRTEDFAPGDWPAEVVAAIRSTNDQLAAALAQIASEHQLNPLDVIVAVIDIPAALARRSLLLNNTTATQHLKTKAAQLSRALLDPA